ncbi:ethylbenzene dehydrogenase-related protein [Sulfurospirillum oryzae]|uniref:ethylbenzene dehydrogenase-related protein n=1 Tax=Sulfurospirillum oryzae TaxID=2976535 RepID=UPI0021E7593F|nr:ethylbenzene dehydrogenase-related protein [Sulfurospirillum oryzae]
MKDFTQKISTAGLSVVMVGSMLLASSALAADYKLESVKGTPTTLDAGDAAWAKAKEVIVPLTETPYQPEGYKGMTKSTAVIKSLYDDKNIYIKLQYDDPTESTARFPWVKQADGSWKRMSIKDQTKHENVYYEDKMAMFWNINTKGFEKKGCAIACHLTKDGKNNGFPDDSAGRKYTNNPGEFIDMWHWKGVRTGLPFDLMHDQYVDSTNDPKLAEEWGRKGDESLGGGYKDNFNADKTGPAFMNKDAKDNAIGSIKEENKIPFVDTFKAGDSIPGIIVSKMSGSSADIVTKAVWKDGKWTMVIKRALVTTHPKSAEQDVQFNDLKKKYYFGVAAFDNSQINHVYHDGSIELTFK